ncbi:MAG: putative baseplate assembly protein [Dehalococcoidia bacterium]|nr:putative baseplate assembly protein [Dehalococcoidia bacterium]
MTTPCNSSPLSPCDCPETLQITRDNPPGQPAISYRLGTHAVLFQQMLERIHSDEFLQKHLTSRSTDDPAVAFLDAWAIVGDVLTFYQERIANEGYLGTATERRSILEMARTIGYELDPGVAASTYLAFTVDSTTDPYLEATISQGTQIQSIPAKGQLPQTFETSQEFIAHAEWNELKPRRSRNQTLALDADGRLCYLALSDKGSHTVSQYFLVNPDPSLQASDHVEAATVNTLYLEGVAARLQPGDLILLAGVKNGGSYKTLVNPIVRLEIQKELNRTVIELDGTSEAITFAPADLSLVNSIATGLSFDAEQVQSNVLAADISQKMLSALMNINQWDRTGLLNHINAIQSAAATLSTFQGVFAFREQVGFFGNTAPKWESLPVSQRYDHYKVQEGGEWKEVDGDPVYEQDWDKYGWLIWKDYPVGNWYSSSGADVYLERKVEGIGKESWTVFQLAGQGSQHRYTALRVTDTMDQSITGFSLSGKSTGLRLREENGRPIRDPYNDFVFTNDAFDEFQVRNTTAHVKSERLALTALPIEDNMEEEQMDAEGNTTLSGVSQMMLEGMVLDLQIDQPVIISGEQADAAGVISSEVALLKDIVHNRGYTVLYFKEALKYRYLRDTVSLSANVVPATHGETVSEVLGSGNGTQTNQRFKLKKPPLTYTSASTETGSESSLTVKVDGIDWEEAGSLYGLDSRTRSYIVRLDNEGNVFITFGDSKMGARLPTGVENIAATYRSGIGFDGEVDAESLKLLKTRPQGIRSVNNPIAASGADDPETMDTARTNAPLTVLTMNRIVSLKDYEDFSRAFSGIGKAQAIVLWNGEVDLVHITIASAGGEALDSTSITYQNLVEAIDTYRNPICQVQVDTFDLRLFHIEAKVKIDSRYVAADVLDQAESALKEAFAFEERMFGQPVTAAEVISIIQQIPGVIYVDLDRLYLADDETGPTQINPPSMLPAHQARWPRGKDFERAQLLLINPVGIKMEEKTS